MKREHNGPLLNIFVLFIQSFILEWQKCICSTWNCDQEGDECLRGIFSSLIEAFRKNVNEKIIAAGRSNSCMSSTSRTYVREWAQHWQIFSILYEHMQMMNCGGFSMTQIKREMKFLNFLVLRADEMWNRFLNK